MKVMKRIFIFCSVFVLLVSGCASSRNLEQAIINQQDLVGLTTKEVVQRLGRPHRLATSLSDNKDAIALWTYYHRNMNMFTNPSGTLNITFTNDVVTNVNYW